MKTGITAHMIVKNEDLWVSYAIRSILPYVDQILITDTGSKDNTVALIKSIKSSKIIFNQMAVRSREDISKIRTLHIKATKTAWIWIVDADEVYSDAGAKEVVTAVNLSKYLAIVVRRFDLLGDIYHRQKETVGSYNMFGQAGHLLVRLINIGRLKNLEVRGDYPLESYYNGDDCVNDLPSKSVYITNHSLYHAMYLKRSSLGGNLSMFNRSKYKIETGLKIKGEIPKVLSGFPKRSLLYEIIASVITPIKNFKRYLS